MCGIFCALSRSKPILPDDELQRRLQKRGPDSRRTIKTTPSHTAAASNLPKPEDNVTICSTVLSLRGLQTVTQPYQDSDETFILCWNGEAWSINGQPTSGNDTAAIHRLLVASVKHSDSSEDVVEDPLESASKVARCLSRVAGPYAFVFLDKSNGRLLFGRDFLGRRSLLQKVTPEGDLVISSVSDGRSEDGWTEIEADGVYCVDLRAVDSPAPWTHSGHPSQRQSQEWGRFTVHCCPYNFAETGDTSVTSVIPRLSLNKQIPDSFEPLNMDSLSVAHLETQLREALALRVMDIPEPPVDKTSSHSLVRAKIAILFSGGLDCTVLARICHDLLPHSEPIDLLNVAFENPRIHKESETANSTAYELCPDRITGRSSYTELQHICPGRDWRFVAINNPYSETTQHREQVVSLLYPHNTEMDLSISYALYFAARGDGLVSTVSGSGPLPYTTAARVLLSGLGADELFGGYTRHATAFRHGGFVRLADELELDVSRLGKRNLGRDDRVMSHWSKEVRFPYLDEKLLAWALNASITEKCGFGETFTSTQTDASEVLEPGKKVLRCLAWKLRMKKAATEKKRAIQFGARTAKMETRKTKGTQLLS